MCIEVGQDFTLPCTQDLGVVLTIGMTPYEVFRAHLDQESALQEAHWSYHKHNTVTGAAPVATQILHAAGIAFASKLRRVTAVTVAYCGNDVVEEPDFLEGVRFSAQHRLPILFLCEHTCQDVFDTTNSCLDKEIVPEQVTHIMTSGADVTQVYTIMQQAMQKVRTGQGPVLLEIFVAQSSSQLQDPLFHAEQQMHTQGIWDEEWAEQLSFRLRAEVEQAMRDALRDTQTITEKDYSSSHIF
jgi:2-oxoisovalerate dehydrogenase E1 component alpha subunit